jgi:6-phosphogluconolactonase (cycloisomerase 2 family)
MKFRKFGRIALALAVSLGTGLGVTSCATDNTVGYMWVTGAQYSQIAAYRIDNNFGQLTQAQNSPYGSGGVNPIHALVANAGKFLYVLNAGCGGTAQVACPANTPPSETGANISLFTVGGGGSLSFQASYTSQGSNPVDILTDTAGKYLFVLDSTVPDPTTCPAYVKGNADSICGDITAFNIDPNTGRLSLITNQQVKDASGTNIGYFPVGSGPIYFAVYSSSYIFTIEKGQTNGPAIDPPQAVFVYNLAESTGQLTLTQNTPIVTNAQQLAFIYASSSYVYLIDDQNGTTTGEILPYTVATNGSLQSVVGGAVTNAGSTANPGPMLVETKGKFLYVANRGPNLSNTSAASTVSAYVINSGTGTAGAGTLQVITEGSSGPVFGSGGSPRCILEDPSNQYLYTANYDSSTVTGAVINQQAGNLTNLRKASSFSTVGNPTWCVASGTLFP